MTEKERQVAEREKEKLVKGFGEEKQELVGGFRKEKQTLEGVIATNEAKLSKEKKEKEEAQQSSNTRKSHREIVYEKIASSVSFVGYLILVLLAYWFNTFLEQHWFLAFMLFELVVAWLGEKYFRPKFRSWIYAGLHAIFER